MYVIHWIDPMIENKAREIVYDKIRQEGIQIPQKNRLQNRKKKKKKKRKKKKKKIIKKK
jgi:hypothetical protein